MWDNFRSVFCLTRAEITGSSVCNIIFHSLHFTEYVLSLQTLCKHDRHFKNSHVISKVIFTAVKKQKQRIH